MHITHDDSTDRISTFTPSRPHHTDAMDCPLPSDNCCARRRRRRGQQARTAAAAWTLAAAATALLLVAAVLAPPGADAFQPLLSGPARQIAGLKRARGEAARCPEPVAGVHASRWVGLIRTEPARGLADDRFSRGCPLVLTCTYYPNQHIQTGTAADRGGGRGRRRNPWARRQERAPDVQQAAARGAAGGADGACLRAGPNLAGFGP